MLAASAALEAVHEIGVENATIKWPNDILIDGAKVAGILIHARHGDPVWATVGLGMNVVSAPRVDVEGALTSTSVSQHLPGSDDSTWHLHLARDFIMSLNRAVDDPQPALDMWRRHLVHELGDSMRVRLASGEVVRGRLVGFSNEGFLHLDDGSGERTLTGGDIVEGDTPFEKID
jgi:BirA family biotin operon repressor/biotin-[acetyl-CoA-carboxylase] ligase